MTLATLNQTFAIAGQVAFVEAAPGMMVANISNAHATASIALQGAHLMTYQATGEQPIIWLSPVAKLVPGKSIRGGVPICWPWFGAHSSDSSFSGHGFARTVPWDVTATETLADGSTRITFEMLKSAMPAAQWPHACRVRNIITVGKKLTMELVTDNTGDAAFELGEALHTYFVVSDLDNMEIHGLDGCTYHDKVGVSTLRKQHGAIVINSEVDRIYVDTESDCLIRDTGAKRNIRIAKRGSLATVVWNPWVEKAAKMGDFGSDTGYRNMVCVESVNAADNVVTVAAGSSHSLWVQYSSEAL